MLTALKRKIPIKPFMAAYLGLLFTFSVIMRGNIVWFVKGIAIVALYSAFDLIWTKIRDRIWYLPVSSWISGCILCIVALPNPPWTLIVVLPLIAVAAKHLLHFGKSRHVFNPAASAMVVASIFVPTVSWWAVSWGNIPLAIVSVVGLFILWRQQRWHTVLAFVASFALSLWMLTLVTMHTLAITDLWTFLRIILTDGTTVFFMTVMLIEPITSGFPTRWQRTVYGALVGIFAVFIPFVLAKFAPTNIDPLLLGLLAGNLVAGLVFLPRKAKRAVST
jgi:Na+-translocating ferredoxin:NAD+ oxidoreductase RnfD subunit